MIINVYLPESDTKILNYLKTVSNQKNRSFSFIVREALEYYLLNVLHLKKEELHLKKRKGV